MRFLWLQTQSIIFIEVLFLWYCNLTLSWPLMDKWDSFYPIRDNLVFIWTRRQPSIGDLNWIASWPHLKGRTLQVKRCNYRVITLSGHIIGRCVSASVSSRTQPNQCVGCHPSYVCMELLTVISSTGGRRRLCPLSLCLVMELCLISGDTQSHRITDAVLRESPMVVHRGLLNDIKVGIWCARSATRITGAVIWHWNVRHILSPFFEYLRMVCALFGPVFLNLYETTAR
jgi:hypothetical protein